MFFSVKMHDRPACIGKYYLTRGAFEMFYRESNSVLGTQTTFSLFRKNSSEGLTRVVDKCVCPFQRLLCGESFEFEFEIGPAKFLLASCLLLVAQYVSMLRVVKPSNFCKCVLRHLHVIAEEMVATVKGY